jgi:hypothetical protein
MMIFLCACSTKSKNSRDTNPNCIIINLDAQKEMIYPASNIFKQVQSIILETKDDCLIGIVTEIQVFDGYIYVLDKLKAKALFVFDMDGRFIRKIGKLGRGPGEYSSISDFTIDPLNKEIYVLDNHKLHKYKIDGTFVKSIVIQLKSQSPMGIQYFDKKIFVNVCNHSEDKDDDYLLQEVDLVSGKIIDSYLKASQYNLGWSEPVSTGHSFFLSRSGSVPKYNQLFMNTIVSLDGIAPYIIIESKDLPEKNDIEAIKKKDIVERSTAVSEMTKIHDIHNYIESDQFIFFNYWHNRQPFAVLHNLKTDSTRIMNFLRNDLVYKNARLLIKFKFSDKDGAYEVCYPEGLFMEEIKNNNLADELDKREQISALSEDSNPIIFYYEYKE